jgi:uncharacterized protein YciI
MYLLFYDYVEDVVERRAPHRERHLERIREWRDGGRIVMAGATGDPPSGALIIFDVDNPTLVEEFADADPYVLAGLVTARRIVPWTVV